MLFGGIKRKKEISPVKFPKLRLNFGLLLRKSWLRDASLTHAKKQRILGMGRGGIFLSLTPHCVYSVIKPVFPFLFGPPLAVVVAFLVASLTICVIGFTH